MHQLSSAFKTVIALFLLFSVWAPARAEETDSPNLNRNLSDHLRVVSYNVQFLPGIARGTNKRSNPMYRAAQIAEKMSAFDIVGLNETFDDEPRKIILDHFKKKWGKDCYILFGPDPRDGRFNGGLSLISRFEFVKTDFVIYKNFSSPWKYGLEADGFAAKGVLHALLALPATKQLKARQLDVFVTHFEARDGSLRRKQFDELAAFMKKHISDKREFVLLGDLNTRGNIKYRPVANSTYQQLFGVLKKASPDHQLVDTWPKIHPNQDGGTKFQTEPTGGPRIDYVIIGQAKSSIQKLQVTQVKVNRYLDEKVDALSDHSAVEATLKWQNKPAE